jgi:uncharacterized protein YbaA (DUF1428 family)
MTYVEGFIVAVPKENREAYRSHASGAAPLFHEFGATRMVEAWANDVPDGKVTDFRKAVQATDDEDVVFSFFEYPSKEVRDGANQQMMSDERMKQMGATMPFDGKRMIFGGFAPLLDKGSRKGAFIDGFVLPVPHGKRQAYIEMAEKAAKKFEEYGALRVVEAWGDDIPDGKLTDFRRAVQAKEEENVVFSWIEWPDKATRDASWEKIMADPSMHPDHGNMPFDGMRMFWGGFEAIVDSGSQGEAAAAERELESAK